MFHTTVNVLRKVSIACATLTVAAPLVGGWSTPAAISSTLSDQPAIAVDANGKAVLVWQGFDGANYNIQAATYTNGSWSAPSTLSQGGQDAQSPQVGVDAAGNATAIWSRYDGWSSIIQGATLPLGGSWSLPANVSDGGQNADSPRLAVDKSGQSSNAVAVWHRYNGYNFIMQSASLPSGGTWTTPASISVSGQDALVPVVAVDPEGNAAAVCSRFDGSNFTSRAAAYLTGQSWGSSITISTPGATSSQQSISIDASGNSLIAWSYFNGSNNIVQVSTLHFGDGWTTPIDISTSGQDSYIPQAIVDAAGNAIVLWVAYDGTHYTAQAASCAAGGSWSQPVVLSSGGDVNNIAIAIDTQGNAIALWNKTDGVDSIIQSSVHPINGSWSPAVDVTPAGKFAYSPTVDVDGNGNAVAAWLESDGTNTTVYAATLAAGG